MLKSIIRIAASAAVLSLLGGCVRTEDLAPESVTGKAIVFDAGSLLLRDDDEPSRAGTFKTGDFVTDDSFTMFGRYHVDESKTMIFNGTTITKGASGWDYAVHRGWLWQTEGDYYDFLAVYPTGKGTSVMDIPGNLAIATDYAIDSDDYDLLYALTRRSGNEADRNRTVHMNFKHVLSAVKVVVSNDSKYASFTLDSYEFRHMTVEATAKATMDGLGVPEISWINTVRNSEAVRGYSSIAATLVGKNVSGTHSHEGDLDLFIPGDLSHTSNGSSSEDYMPHLIVKYTPDGESQQTAEILLKDIQRDPMHGDTTPIDVWAPGVRYTYYVNIRLDGGVIVTVITTDWDTVEAETPGLMID